MHTWSFKLSPIDPASHEWLLCHKVYPYKWPSIYGFYLYYPGKAPEQISFVNILLFCYLLVCCLEIISHWHKIIQSIHDHKPSWFYIMVKEILNIRKKGINTTDIPQNIYLLFIHLRFYIFEIGILYPCFFLHFDDWLISVLNDYRLISAALYNLTPTTS